MITIFGDFRQFLAKKLAFFSKTNDMIKIFHNLCSYALSQKRPFFGQNFGLGENILENRKILGENILENHKIGPWDRYYGFKKYF
jgi:hypothetical protein